ncbi:MAG: hypothetical protein RLZZ77_2024 [Bacteroidota bacterium]|jgi:ABC-type bacteriocin/lantibiotic exporter with double-glycine peptidase domain
MTPISPFKRLLQLLQEDRSDIRSIYLLAIFTGLINLSLPLGIQAILSYLNAGELSTSWGVLVFIVLISVAVVGILQIKQIGITESIEQRIFTRAAFEFAYRFTRFRQEDMNNKYAPELVNRFFEIMTIQKGLSKLLIDFSAAFLQILFGLLLLTLYHPLFLAFGLGLIALLYAIYLLTGKIGLKTSLEESKYKFEVAHWLEEIGRTMSTFKLLGNSELPLGKTDQLTQKYLKARQSHFKILVWQFSGLIIFKLLVIAGLLIVGSYLVVNNLINIGQFVASEIIILLIISSVEKVIMSMNNVYDVLTALEKVGHVTDIPLETQTGDELPENKEHAMSVEFSKVSFSFPNEDHFILADVDLSIKAGEHILVCGKNGSGKTTLLRLISGLYTTFQGSISFNGLPLRNLQPEALRTAIGDHFHASDVFRGTFLENIQAGRYQLSLSDVQAASEMVGLSEYIQNLPLGYSTPIDPEGKQWPSGVVRKIILARAILGHPKLLLIEDNLMSLPDRYAIFQRILAPENKWTVVVISSDIKLAQRVDRVVVLDKGTMLEAAPFAQLNNKQFLTQNID